MHQYKLNFMKCEYRGERIEEWVMLNVCRLRGLNPVVGSL